MTPGDPEDTDRWLRDALDDAVADVEPAGDLDDIRARIEEDAMSTRTRQRWGAAAAGLAVAATVAAVALATGLDDPEPAAGPAASPSATVSADGTEPSGPTEPSEPSQPSGSEGAARIDGPLPVYYVGETPTGPRLFREFHAPPSETGDALALAVDMAVSAAPYDPDYRSPWPAGTTASASYDEAGELLTVDLRSTRTDLRSRPGGMDADEARMALEQLIHTAQAVVQDRAPVRFLLDGEITDQLLGEAASEPLAEGDPMQVQAPVWIISPQDGTAMNTLTVQGRGAFFEANVSWQLLAEGEVVEEGFATAEECCTLSPYSFEVPDVPPGDYVLRVYDADMSGGEGPGEQEDTKRITVTG